MDITAIIIAKNEEKNIRKSLESVSFCKHIIVADDNSTDETVAIARQAEAKILKLPEGENFPRKRLLAMDKADTAWVLFLDADEEISPELQQEIRELTDPAETAFYLRRRDFWWDKELRHGETLKAREKGICRLLRADAGRWIGEVHEEWQPLGKTARLKGFINHYPHPTLKEFIADINDYSSRRASELHSLGVKPSMFKLLTYPFSKFILTYILYLGFMDGPPGFVYSFMMSFHSFLVRAKLYQYTKLSDNT